jgi:mannose-6-phosphate isomerase-like protein (cupin superfamily)
MIMIKAGFTFEQPATKNRTTVLESDAETNGMGWLLELTIYAKVQSDISEHMHMTWTETFEIISGSAKYKLDGIEKTAKAGESFVVEPRHFHVHPWNASDEKMVYRQRNRFAQPSSAAVQDILGMFATRAGMARDGKLPASGFGKLMQRAATVRIATKHGNYVPSPSIFAQNVLGSTVGLFAELLGYIAVYPQYVAG